MAERTRAKKAKIDLSKVIIKRAYEFDNGNVSFDMEYCGVMLYRNTVVKSKKGGEFISFPSYESNGKWFNYHWMDLSQEDQEKIIDLVYDSLND